MNVKENTADSDCKKIMKHNKNEKKLQISLK